MPEPLDLAEVRATWLAACGPCDYGLVEYGCTCPPGDCWSVLMRALDELEQARQRLAAATRYSFNTVPETVTHSYLWQVDVEWCGGDRWAVRHGRWCLGVDELWDYEPQPSSCVSAWLAAHRFDLETALRLAAEAAPGVIVNGMSAREAADRAAAAARAGNPAVEDQPPPTATETGADRG
jgi:hypothetical protein